MRVGPWVESFMNSTISEKVSRKVFSLLDFVPSLAEPPVGIWRHDYRKVFLPIAYWLGPEPFPFDNECGQKHDTVEQIVTRLSFEPGIAAVSWSVVPTMMK